jgi:hypothetical protein
MITADVPTAKLLEHRLCDNGAILEIVGVLSPLLVPHCAFPETVLGRVEYHGLRASVLDSKVLSIIDLCA